MLEERIRLQLKVMREGKRANGKFNTLAVKAFLTEQEDFLAHMNNEIVEDELVIKGEIDNSQLSSVIIHKAKKRKLSNI